MSHSACGALKLDRRRERGDYAEQLDPYCREVKAKPSRKDDRSGIGSAIEKSDKESNT